MPKRDQPPSASSRSTRSKASAESSPGKKSSGGKRSGDSTSADSGERQDSQWRDEQFRKLEFLEQRDEQLAARRDRSFSDRVRYYDPGRVSKFRRVRAYSSVLTILAYMWVPLVIALAITLIVAIDARFIEVLAGVLATLLVAGTGFVALKLAAEAAWSLADIGDRQTDTRDVLLDLYELQERQFNDGARPLDQAPPGSGR